MTMIQRIFLPQKFTGWHMIGVLVAFFGTIITVNLIMAWFATSSWTGLVVKNSYVASQHFNEDTAAKRAQLAMGWKAVPEYRPGELDIFLTDARTAPLAGAIITARLGRPAFDRDDHTVQFSEKEAGVYTGETELAPGVWIADLTVTGPGGDLWTRTLRFEVR